MPDSSRVSSKQTVYANFAITKGWTCWAVLFPIMGGVALIFTNNDPAKDEVVVPLWLGVIAYSSMCVGQYLYFRYAPTIRQATRISRKFVWWKRLIIASMHCALLTAFFWDEYRQIPEIVTLVLIAVAYLTIVPIWNRDLENKIRL